MDAFPIHLAKDASRVIERSMRNLNPDVTVPQISRALRVWQALLPHLQVDSVVLPATAADVQKELDMQSGIIAKALKDLDNAGVIKRAPFPVEAKRGNQKAILINPEYAYVARTRARHDLVEKYHTYEPIDTRGQHFEPIDSEDD